MKNVLVKIFDLQQTVKAIEKDSTNPYFNSQYFDINKIIETLKPILKDLKLAIYQPIIFIEGKNILKTVIADIETSEVIESQISLPDNLEPQKMGSAITYLRRYCLQSMLFLQAEDDDGSTASPKNTALESYGKNIKSNTNKKFEIPF
jgi:hypothetical protein